MDAIFTFERNEADDHYHILGCDELSSVEQIMCEYKKRALLCHPDKHPGDPTAVQKFACLQRAKEVLCTGERKDYDQWRRSGMAIPYEQWAARKHSIQTSMHWAMPAKKEPMLEEGPSTKTFLDSHNDDDSWTTSWRHHEPASEILRRFRNYQI